MTDITEAERSAIATAIGEALASDAPEAESRGGAAAAARATPKEFFCENWPTIKAGLEILKDFVPALVRPLIAIVIRAGDAAAGVICT